jgi:hypothetical protein
LEDLIAELANVLDATDVEVSGGPDGQEISIVGKVTEFQERRGGVWVNALRWIYAA